LYLLGQRWYDEDVGRFISRDPIGEKEGGLNLYYYVSNKPLYFVDPNGEIPLSCLVGVAVWILCDPCWPIGEIAPIDGENDKIIQIYPYEFISYSWDKCSKKCKGFYKVRTKKYGALRRCIGIGWIRAGYGEYEEVYYETVDLGTTETSSDCANKAQGIK
jgi:uncharacterized protein RhaS with RHS repeats